MRNKIENPSKILTYLLALFFFSTPLDYVLPHIGSATVLLFLGAVISVVVVYLLLVRGNPYIGKDQLCVILLIVLAVISILWAQETEKAFSSGLSFVATAAMYALLFSFSFSKDEIRLFEKASIVGGIGLIIYVFTQVDLDMVQAGYRLALNIVGNKDYFSDPNGLAARLVMPTMFMVKNIFENPKKRYKLICIASVLAIVYIIFLTGSRAAVITLVTMFVLILLHYSGKRAGIALALLVLTLVVALCIPNLLPEHIYDRIFTTDKYQEITTERGDRIDIWKNVLLKFFPDAPILGYGIGNSSIVLKQHYKILKAVHNSWLVILTELGLLGFIPCVALVLGKIKRAFILRKENIYVLAILVGSIIMATTLDSEKDKYLWNAFLYVHLIKHMYIADTKEAVDISSN